MKATIHVEGKNAKELADGVRAHLAVYEAAAGGKTAPAKPGKSGKSAAPADDEDEELDISDDEDEESEEEETEEGESEEEEETEEEEEEEEEESGSLSLQDLIGAFQKYAKKHSREKAKKILAKFKVAGVKDLKKADYKAVMKLLK